ncbi:CVNH domain-containing protein [Cercophora newfieldiana]|uniref:CVNH domain-containing protein n=1 Tax=Cercophora newfieldiana TaxID=92897 RepID=A0AA39Y6T6_9PEZI|nr:CVNH domain-containing protein [Cercophora newfieldiana]
MSYYGGNNSYPQGGQSGEAASYYNDHQQQQQYPPPQYQQQQQQQQYPPNGQQYPPQQYSPNSQQYDQRYPNNQAGFQPDGPDGERGVLGAIGGGLAGGVSGHAIGGKANHSKLGTVLGVVGGAFAGHKLQDGISDWKDKRDDEKKHSSPSHSQESLTPHGVRYLGNFSSSSRDMRIDPSGEYTLHASCQRVDGSFQASSISLNRFLENDRGSLRWVSGPGEKRDQVVVAPPRQVTVQAGDTLRGIARQVGAEFDEIARVNGIQNPDLIYPGQVLNIPGAAPVGGGGGGSGGAGNFGQSARNVRLVDGGRRLEAELLRDGQWVGSSIVLDERIGNDNGTLSFKS